MGSLTTRAPLLTASAVASAFRFRRVGAVSVSALVGSVSAVPVGERDRPGCRLRRPRSRASMRNGKALLRCEVRAYRLDDPSSFEVLAHFRGLLAQTLGELVDLGVDFGVGRPRCPPARRRRATRGRRAPRRSAPSRTPSTNACWSWPVAARYCGIVRPALLLEPVREIVEPTLHLLAHERVGDVVGARAPTRPSSTLSRTSSCACICA